MVTTESPTIRQSGYTPEDLQQLRLAGIPLLLIAYYVFALALAVAPIRSDLGLRYWAAGLSPIFALGIFVVWRKHARLGGALLVGGLLSCWLVALWLTPAGRIVWLAVLVIGSASIGFGPRAAVLLAMLMSLAMLTMSTVGHLDLELASAGSVIGLLEACLFWLTARPSTTALRWAWVSYVDALTQRDQLRQHQAELHQTLKTLDLAYQRLEHLNEELSRARQAAETAQRAKSEFAASISHELRTPLNLILGFSEILATAPRDQIPQEFQVDIDVIYRNSQHLSALIEDVLDLAQIEAGRLAVVRDRVPLGDVIEEAVSAIAARVINLGLSLNVTIADDLPPVFIDRTRIRQVLINLLNNAVRFTDHGGIHIAAHREGNDVIVAVSDSGVGIAPSDLPHVFEEFYQTDSALKRRVGGSGLGLTISKRIVEQHGGAMWATSTVGVGSTFSFSLPLTENVVTGLLPGEWTLWDRVAPRKEPMLAIVAADERIGRAFQRSLNRYRIRVLTDLKELPDLLNEGSVRGVVVASPSPTLAWQTLHRISDAGFSLPVAVFSVSGWHDRANELGVMDYLSKPILREDIERVLGRLGRGPRTILIVDDNPDMVRLLARTIQRISRRFRIYRASGGEEALGLARDRRPDLILLDLLMPDVDGYHVLAEMQADERLRDIPVVVVSARRKTSDVPIVGIVGFTRTDGLSLSETTGCLEACFDIIQP